MLWLEITAMRVRMGAGMRIIFGEADGINWSVLCLLTWADNDTEYRNTYVPRPMVLSPLKWVCQGDIE